MRSDVADELVTGLPQLLFVLDGTGPAGIETRIGALHAAARALTQVGFRHVAPVLAAPMVDLLRNGPRACAGTSTHVPACVLGSQ
ncbi:hypothetical protein [Streptomyces sp. ALI-76-A]|uniref:hypothetical protein n=1 Tax=Streptomyces sp. ALI-76-A TaxID=3025736 RepID=UPI00256F1903|nr:hypothetical protein [Streptomyces sp. ALI-76-A]MDL5198866.1 hypothetical protein [Streptomyces sp. ALI-76-A]